MFQEVKDRLTTGPILAIFDPTLTTELHTDASSLGVGFMLMQRTKDGIVIVVAYYSKQTTLRHLHFQIYLLGL